MKKHLSLSEFEAEFHLFCKRHSLLCTNSILVAFSGGADSAVLLTLLQKVCQKRQIRLTAFHVNHMIRGKEADRDACFCQEFCRERGIPFVCEQVDIPSIAKSQKTGLEETARNERYRLLLSYAEKENFSKIATAHNATDNMETVLFHLVRGMSIHGAGGIHPARQNIIRPLLPFSKDDILYYAEQTKIPFVTDSTNSDIDYTRNYIRHGVLPKLHAINPEADQAVLRFCESARQDDAFLYRLAEQFCHTNDTTELASLDVAILSRVLLIKISTTANTEISEKQVRTLVEKIQQAAQENFCGQIQLSGHLFAVISPETFQLTQTQSPAIPFAHNTERISLSPPQDVCFGNNYHIHISMASYSPNETKRNGMVVYISQNSVRGSLYLRHREEGDRYIVGGMTRRIKKLLCDAKISLEKRASLPILCDEIGIVYVPHLSVADRAKPQPNDICYRIEITEL